MWWQYGRRTVSSEIKKNHPQGKILDFIEFLLICKNKYKDIKVRDKIKCKLYS